MEYLQVFGLFFATFVHTAPFRLSIPSSFPFQPFLHLAPFLFSTGSAIVKFIDDFL